MYLVSIHQLIRPCLKNVIQLNQLTTTFRLLSPAARRCLSSSSSPFDPKRVTPVCLRAREFPNSIAVTDRNGQYSYSDLLKHSHTLSKQFADICGPKRSAADQDRIAFLCSNDASYVITQWATWLSGNIAVPLHKSHPTPQLEYYIEDSKSVVIVATTELVPKVEPIAHQRNIPLIVLDSDFRDNPTEAPSTPSCVPDDFFNAASALIMYTSGTTGPPKGVLLSHANLHAQVSVIVEALQFSSDDSVLHMLPLHHTHGIVHALLSPLHVGARCVMLPQFDSAEAWKHLLSAEPPPSRVNVMLAVPTMYVKLIEEYRKCHGPDQLSEKVKAICQEKMRLMVSGSSALPQPILEQWEKMTGHRTLERYGGTEMGLVLTNPVNGERKPGFVGNPLSFIEVRIAQENAQAPNGYEIIAVGNAKGTTVTPGREKDQGELLVKGPNVFKGYWNKPEATEKTFSPDGWFKTGDTVSYQEGSYKIEGRSSVDIIKSGGYKISALDVERHLLSHPDIAEVVVVGVPDPTWGQRVAAVVVLRTKQATLDLPQLRNWCKERMAPYIVPSLLKLLDGLPKNAVGKVNKKELVKEMFPDHKA